MKELMPLLATTYVVLLIAEWCAKKKLDRIEYIRLNGFKMYTGLLLTLNLILYFFM